MAKYTRTHSGHDKGFYVSWEILNSFWDDFRRVQRCSFFKKLFLPVEHTIATNNEPHANATLDRQTRSLWDGNSFLSQFFTLSWLINVEGKVHRLLGVSLEISRFKTCKPVLESLKISKTSGRSQTDSFLNLVIVESGDQPLIESHVKEMRQKQLVENGARFR